MIADLDGPQLAGGVLANLLRFTNWGVVGGHDTAFHTRCACVLLFNLDNDPNLHDLSPV